MAGVSIEASPPIVVVFCDVQSLKDWGKPRLANLLLTHSILHVLNGPLDNPKEDVEDGDVDEVLHESVIRVDLLECVGAILSRWRSLIRVFVFSLFSFVDGNKAM